MSSPRLASGIWVSAYLRRLQLAGIPAYVIARGDPAAGALYVKLARLDGTARAWQRRFDLTSGTLVWDVLAEGAEADVDATLARARSRDPDLWLVEVEDRLGRNLLGEEGLSGA